MFGMALSSPAATLFAPSALGALQHLQHLQHITGAAARHAPVTAAVSSDSSRNFCAQSVTPSSNPPTWQSTLKSQLFPAPRYNSTVTPMTMNPAFATGNTSGKDLVSTISSFVSLTVTERSTSLPHLAEQLVHFAPQLQPEDIASVAVAFARMGFSHTGLASALAMQVTSRMPMCSPEAVAQTAWAFAELQYYNYEFLAQLMQYMQENYSKFSAPDLARILWAMGKLGYQNDVVVDLWHELALKTTADLDCKSMTEVLNAEAISGVGSSDDVTLQNMIADYAAANLDNFDGEDLGKLSYGLARFCYEDAELYDMMAKRAVEIWERLRPVDVRRIMTAYGDLGHFNRALLDCIADKWLVAHRGDPALEMTDLRLIVRAFNVLGYSNPNISEAIKHAANTI